MTVWDGLVGQDEVTSQLRRVAVDAAAIRAGRPGPAMTHAWLLTGPPGSGRSTAALALAAALQCEQAAGCGHCPDCREVASEGHPDVERFVPEATQIRVPEVQELLRKAALAPIHGKWNVIIIEDADRLNDVAANALLKAVEEPNPHAVWVLCAPAVDDVLPTIASRTRVLRLRTPSTAEVSSALTAAGVDAAMASFAARVAQGHVGRARALAVDESVRARRHEVMVMPTTLRGVGGCFTTAGNLLAAATADAAAICDELDAAQAAAVARAFGEPQGGPGGARVRRAAGAAQKELLAKQKARRTRTIRDQLDRALVDLTSFYRDVLAVQVGAEVELINEELRPAISGMAARTGSRTTQHCLSAVNEARLALAAAVSPLLALEAMMVQLGGLS